MIHLFQEILTDLSEKLLILTLQSLWKGVSLGLKAFCNLRWIRGSPG